MLRVSGFDLIESDHPEAWIVGIGRVRERNSQRSDRPRNEPLTRGCAADTIGPFAALPRRLLIDIPSQAAEERIVDDLLVERRILASAVLPRIVDKEFALGDIGGPEGVCLDDVRACFQKPAMDIANRFWLSQREQVTVVQKALRRVLESLASDIRFRHAVGADSRAHRAVDDRDSIL